MVEDRAVQPRRQGIKLSLYACTKACGAAETDESAALLHAHQGGLGINPPCRRHGGNKNVRAQSKCVHHACGAAPAAGPVAAAAGTAASGAALLACTTAGHSTAHTLLEPRSDSQQQAARPTQQALVQGTGDLTAAGCQAPGHQSRPDHPAVSSAAAHRVPGAWKLPGGCHS